MKESSYEIVLDNNENLQLGLGGFAKHDMRKGSKIAVARGVPQ